MQPPPRKGNYAKFLKNLHAEQINKLNLKNQHECELLEDLKSFTIKRSALERTYAEELLKLTSQYLNKKAPNIPDLKLEGSEEKWNMWSVWRTVLEENEKLAQARLAAVEIFQQQIADDAKILKSHKIQSAKKCLDQLAQIQKELQACVQEVDKTKKLYFDEEHSAHGIRDKARDIEEKLKKKKGGFFTSITSLQKNSAKYTTKREQLDEKSTGARNDYLLCLAAANAHQNRYFLVDLQLCMTTMEGGVYEKVAEYLSLMGRTELLTCSAWQNSFTNIRDQAKQLTRDYNIQCCYLYYPVLKQHIQYPFESCDNDPVETITAEHDSAAATLSKEARRWATRIARENNAIRESVKRLQIYSALRESGQKVDPNDPNGPDLETKIEEMRQAIRKAETAKSKAEARIEALREGGVNVDEWLQEAESLNVQDIQRSASSLSVRTYVSASGDHPSSDSFYDSDFADAETVAVPQQQQQQEKQPDKDSVDSQQDQFENPEVDAMLEQERQRIEQLTAGWDDPTQVDWGAEEFAEHETLMTRQESTPSIPLLKCTALYSYTAQNPDELTIVENEQLEVVGEGDGDGWLRARNYKGEEGYVPHNYLDVEREQTATTPGLVNQISFSSVDYTVDNEEDVQMTASETNQSPEQVSIISVQQKVPESPPATYCCALYDYEGEGDEELTFEEGQIIKVLSKCAHSVDDGWWRGELEGRVGNFPSLVVEECDEFGEPLTNQWDETPPQSAPPVFTPPDVPPDVPDFVLATQVIITQPTPSVELAQQPPSVPKQGEAQAAAEGSFSMVLSRDQHQQYGSQFQGEVPTIDVPSVEVFDEDDESGAPTAPKSDDFGLGVAQIVITAATPMMEEPEHPFPPPEEPPVNHHDDDIDTTIPEEDEETCDEAADPPPPPAPCDDPDDVDCPGGGDSTPFVVSSSTGSDGETTGPSTAENSVSHVAPAPPPPDAEPKQVVGGRASIPDELEPHQLARLQDLKESNA